MGKTFNLIDEPFIPCRTKSGETRLWNLRDALLQSHDIVEIADASPLTTFALYRFLLVIVHRCLDASNWQTIWDAGRLPEERIEEYIAKYRNRFDLFDAERPFLQKSGELDLKSPMYLFAELPTASNINHARHTYDDVAMLCPSCSAAGLLRVSVFSTKGGRGYSPSINGKPPAYLLPLGENLFATLLLNWPLADPVNGDKPVWESHESVSETHIGLLEAFTRQARSVRLIPSIGNDEKCCLCGGVSATMIRQIGFESGANLKDKRIADWRDPHVIYREELSTNKPKPPSKLSATKDPVNSNGNFVGFWRQFVTLLLSKTTELQAVQNRAFETTRLKRPANSSSVFAILTSTEDMKWSHDESDFWKIPPLDDAVRLSLLAELEWIDANLDRWAKQRANGKKNKQQGSAMGLQPDFVSLAEFERRAEGHFRRLLAGTIETTKFRQCIQNDVIELTRPVPRPQRPLESLRLKRESEKAVKAAFPISEVAS